MAKKGREKSENRKKIVVEISPRILKKALGIPDLAREWNLSQKVDESAALVRSLSNTLDALSGKVKDMGPPLALAKKKIEGVEKKVEALSLSVAETSKAVATLRKSATPEKGLQKIIEQLQIARKNLSKEIEKLKVEISKTNKRTTETIDIGLKLLDMLGKEKRK